MITLARLVETFNQVRQLPHRISTLEDTMASASEQINAVSGRLDDFVSDVNAEIATLKGKAGQLDDEGQAALDRLTQKLADADLSVGDADGSDTPAPVEPSLPATDDAGSATSADDTTGFGTSQQ